MADMMSIIAANYKTVGMTVPSKTPYVAVDPALYEGSWTGKYADKKTFKITVSNVTGFRAKVQYQSGGTSKFQEVLIKDNAFRVGDTKFSSQQTIRRWSRTSSPTPPAGRPTSIRPTRSVPERRREFRAPTCSLVPAVDQKPDMAQALRSVARRRCGASLVRSSAWK